MEVYSDNLTVNPCVALLITSYELSTVIVVDETK